VKVDNSWWRCTRPVDKSITGECDAIIIQQQMESHLASDHGLVGLKPVDVVQTFVLIRTAEVKRGPERRDTVDDETIPMFERGKDFR